MEGAEGRRWEQRKAWKPWSRPRAGVGTPPPTPRWSTCRGQAASEPRGGKGCGGSRKSPAGPQGTAPNNAASPALRPPTPCQRYLQLPPPPPGLQLIAPPPPAAQGPWGAGRRGPGAPRAVITAAVAAARRVSASAPPPRLIGAASRGRGRRATRSRNERCIDRPRGQQLVKGGGGGGGKGWGVGRRAVPGIEGARGDGAWPCGAHRLPRRPQGAVAAAPFAVAPECPSHRPGPPPSASLFGGALGPVPDPR